MSFLCFSPLGQIFFLPALSKSCPTGFPTPPSCTQLLHASILSFVTYFVPALPIFSLCPSLWPLLLTSVPIFFHSSVFCFPQCFQVSFGEQSCLSVYSWASFICSYKLNIAIQFWSTDRKECITIKSFKHTHPPPPVMSKCERIRINLCVCVCVFIFQSFSLNSNINFQGLLLMKIVLVYSCSDLALEILERIREIKWQGCDLK